MLVSKRRIWKLGKQTPPFCSQEKKYPEKDLEQKRWWDFKGLLEKKHLFVAGNDTMGQSKPRDGAGWLPRSLTTEQGF